MINHNAHIYDLNTSTIMRCDAYAEEDIKDAMNISSKITREHIHDSALMTAAHILVCLTQEGKSLSEIAREDFDDNLELVTVWADYMVGVNWMYPDGENKWVPTDTGKRRIQKVSAYLYDQK